MTSLLDTAITRAKRQISKSLHEIILDARLSTALCRLVNAQLPNDQQLSPRVIVARALWLADVAVAIGA